MRRIWLLMGVGLIAAMLAVAAVACDDDEPSEEEATAQLCADLVALAAADAEFDDLSADSTVDEINAANEAYSKALDKAVDSAGGVAAAKAKPIEDAYAALDKAIGDIPGDATITEALASITDELDAVDAAWVQAFSGVDCP